jgi:BCL2-associated athanogene 2
LIQFLDSIDNRVEDLRKEAIKLQDQRDHLLTRIDLLKNTDLLTNLNEEDQEEIGLHLKRINERLQVRIVQELV